MNRSTAPLQPPAPGPWVEQWLSRPRLSVYMSACGHDLTKALALYEWNSAVSSAVLRDLAHFEIALRNAYDRSITSRWSGTTHWLLDPRQRLFGPVWRTRGGRRVDINDKPRRSIEEAVRRCGGATALPGKVIAELSFGFWRYLTSSAHEKTLWVPYLHTAFPPGTVRKDVDTRIARLNELRNRIAHHEPVLSQPLSLRSQDLIYLCGLFSAQLATYVEATSTVDQLLKRRP